MKWHKVFVAACVVAAGATLSAAAFAEGEEEAVDFRVTSDAVAINLHTDDAALRFSSAELAAKQVTYRAGETVTLTAPDGTTATVVADAAAAGGATLAVGAGGLSSDGLWRLDNSNGSVAFVGVAWETFGAAPGGRRPVYGAGHPCRRPRPQVEEERSSTRRLLG